MLWVLCPALTLPSPQLASQHSAHLVFRLALDVARNVGDRVAAVLLACAHKGIELAPRPLAEALLQQLLALCSGGGRGRQRTAE